MTQAFRPTSLSNFFNLVDVFVVLVPGVLFVWVLTPAGLGYGNFGTRGRAMQLVMMLRFLRLVWCRVQADSNKHFHLAFVAWPASWHPTMCPFEARFYRVAERMEFFRDIRIFMSMLPEGLMGRRVDGEL